MTRSQMPMIVECAEEYLRLLYKRIASSIHEYICCKELTEPILELLSLGGKRFRPLLMFASYGAVGGSNPEETLPFAQALENIHMATLFHDDLIDRAMIRRGAPPAHVKYGGVRAVLAGDSLLNLAYNLLSEELLQSQEKDKWARIISLISSSCTLVLEGEILESSLPPERLCVDEYYKIASMKTGSLFRAAALSGSILGNGSDYEEQYLSSFSLNLGIGYQIRDDLLDFRMQENNIRQNPVELGKNLMIIHALQNATPPIKRRILYLLGQDQLGSDDAKKLIDLLQELGSIAFGETQANNYLERAQHDVKALKDSTYKELLEQLARKGVMNRSS